MQDAHYLLRPETMESLFYLWRVTGKQKYREWAWHIFRALHRWCPVRNGAYTSLNSILQVSLHCTPLFGLQKGCIVLDICSCHLKSHGIRTSSSDRLSIAYQPHPDPDQLGPSTEFVRLSLQYIRRCVLPVDQPVPAARHLQVCPSVAAELFDAASDHIGSYK